MSTHTVDRGAVQQASERLYDRLGRSGSRVVVVCCAAATVVGVVTLLIGSAWFARYLRFSTRQYWEVCGLIVGLGAAGGAVGLYTARHMLSTVWSWSGAGKTPERAPEVWQVAVRAPFAITGRALAGAYVAAAPLALVIVDFFNEPRYAAVTFFVWICLGGFGAAVAVAFGVELVYRPMIEDIVSYLPEDFEPSGRMWRLRAKALAPLPGITLFAAATVGAFGEPDVSGALRMTTMLGIVLGTVAVAGGIFFVVTRSMLDPLDDLLAATRRVRAGDITTKVPVVTADDLGTLAHSFNQMLDELRDNQDELRASRARIVVAADQERRRVERDLHDGAQQHLVVLGLKLGLAGKQVAGNSELTTVLDGLKNDLDDALRSLRDLAHGIYPALLANEGLPAALEEAVGRAAIPATLEIDGAGRYPAEIEAAVYFCALEALQNASKHAGGDARATVRLAERGNALVFEIADDGVGFEAVEAQTSSGLQNMTDRIGALGGDLVIESAVGGGTAVRGTIPLTVAVR